MENRFSVSEKIYALAAATVASYFLGSVKPEIQIPVTAFVASLGANLIVPFGEPYSAQRAIALIPAVALAASFIWLLTILCLP